MSENPTTYATTPKYTIESLTDNEAIFCKTYGEQLDTLALLEATGVKGYCTAFVLGEGWAISIVEPDESSKGMIEDFEAAGYIVIPASDFLPADRTEAPAYAVTMEVTPPQSAAPDFQHKIMEWLKSTFERNVWSDKQERAMRFCEESLELCQSVGMGKEQALKLVEYVFNRPTGETAQEIGGTMVTLAALCSVVGINMTAAGNLEYDRINAPEMREKIKAKQVTKNLAGITPSSFSIEGRLDEVIERLKQLQQNSEHATSLSSVAYPVAEDL